MILQPESGVNVARGRRSAHDAPVGAVEVFPGELFTGVDLVLQLLALFGRAGDEQCAVRNDLLVRGLSGLTVVPVLRVVGILVQTIAGGGENDLGAVVIEDVGAAGDEADVDRAGFKTFADRFIRRADGDLHFADFVAESGKLFLEHLLERFGGGDDLLRLAGRDERDLQGVDLLRGGFSGGGLFRGGFSGGLFRGGSLGSGRGLGGGAAAGQQAERHNDRQQERKNLFHPFSSDNTLFFLAHTQKARCADPQNEYSTPRERKIFRFSKNVSSLKRSSTPPAPQTRGSHGRKRDSADFRRASALSRPPR